MIFKDKFLRIAITISLFILVAGCLFINESLFIHLSYTPYFLFTTVASLFILFAGLIIILNDNKPSTPVPIPIFLVLTFLIYIIINSAINVNTQTFSLHYLIISCLLILALYIVFKSINYPIKLLLWVIVVLAVLESIICISQYFNLVKSFNPFFPVTGTWVNPNVTAIFLAMSFPAIISLIALSKKNRGVIIVFGLIVTIALILLKCRTAYIGVLVPIILLSNWKFNLWGKFINKNNRLGSILIVLIFILITTPLIYKLYTFKQSSADGRLLIWKISLDMIADKPLTGYGYGSFEKHYNIYQSEYFKNDKGSNIELQNSGYTHMAYNEILQLTIEGGIIGLFILLFPIGILVWIIQKHFFYSFAKSIYYYNHINSNWEFIACYSGVMAFILMSVSNFSMQAIPAFCLFIIYYTIICTHPTLQKQFLSNKIQLYINHLFSIKQGNILLANLLIFLGCYFFYTQVLLAKANYHNKQAKNLLQQNQIFPSIMLLKSLEPKLSYFESYWTNFGNALYLAKDYDTAIKKYQKATELTSNPYLFKKLAECYHKVRNYQLAEINYVLASDLEPARMGPKYDLMMFYKKTLQNDKAIAIAEEIVMMKPKIVSSLSKIYQLKALSILGKNSFPNQNLLIPKTNKNNSIPIMINKRALKTNF